LEVEEARVSAQPRARRRAQFVTTEGDVKSKTLAPAEIGARNR